MSILLTASRAEKTLRAVIRTAATLESALEAMLETESPEDEQEDQEFQTRGHDDFGAEYFKINHSTDEEKEGPDFQIKSAKQKESLNQNGNGQDGAEHFDIAGDDDADEEVQEGPVERT